jgi:cyclic pyranopterin monophosphate synthase
LALRQVDVSRKPVQRREAVATGRIKLNPRTIQLIKEGKIEKGDPLQLARVGGILAAKHTPEIMPLCHQLRLEAVEVNLEIRDDHVEAVSRVVASERTGVEMEALTAVTGALLNIWDAVKQYEKDSSGQYPSTEIYGVKVISKVKVDDAT